MEKNTAAPSTEENVLMSINKRAKKPSEIMGTLLIGEGLGGAAIALGVGMSAVGLGLAFPPIIIGYGAVAAVVLARVVAYEAKDNRWLNRNKENIKNLDEGIKVEIVQKYLNKKYGVEINENVKDFNALKGHVQGTKVKRFFDTPAKDFPSLVSDDGNLGEDLFNQMLRRPAILRDIVSDTIQMKQAEVICSKSTEEKITMIKQYAKKMHNVEIKASNTEELKTEITSNKKLKKDFPNFYVDDSKLNEDIKNIVLPKNEKWYNTIVNGVKNIFAGKSSTAERKAECFVNTAVNHHQTSQVYIDSQLPQNSKATNSEQNLSNKIQTHLSTSLHVKKFNTIERQKQSTQNLSKFS